MRALQTEFTALLTHQVWIDCRHIGLHHNMRLFKDNGLHSRKELSNLQNALTDLNRKPNIEHNQAR